MHQLGLDGTFGETIYPSIMSLLRGKHFQFDRKRLGDCAVFNPQNGDLVQEGSSSDRYTDVVVWFLIPVNTRIEMNKDNNNTAYLTFLAISRLCTRAKLAATSRCLFTAQIYTLLHMCDKCSFEQRPTVKPGKRFSLPLLAHQKFQLEFLLTCYEIVAGTLYKSHTEFLIPTVLSTRSKSTMNGALRLQRLWPRIQSA